MDPNRNSGRLYTALRRAVPTVMGGLYNRLVQLVGTTCWRRRRSVQHDAALDVLAPILQSVPPVAPPTGLLERIESQIDKDGGTDGSRVSIAPATSLAARSLVAGIAVVALMAALLAGTWMLHRPTSCAPRVLAVLNVPAATDQLRIETVECARYLRIHHRGDQTPERRTFELWIVQAGNHRPVSLGLLAAKGTITVLPLYVAIEAGDRLFVSQESIAGAPGDRPSGPIVGRADVREE